jgi:hypothetical protein
MILNIAIAESFPGSLQGVVNTVCIYLSKVDNFP